MIPLSTTTIAVLRTPEPDRYAEPYSGTTDAARTAIATGVRAVITRPGGKEDVEGGEQSTMDMYLIADAMDINYDDLVRDEQTGQVYRVTWEFAYPDHIEARLRLVQGVV